MPHLQQVRLQRTALIQELRLHVGRGVARKQTGGVFIDRPDHDGKRPALRRAGLDYGVLPGVAEPVSALWAKSAIERFRFDFRTKKLEN